MSYIIVRRKAPEAPWGLSGASACEWDMDCHPESGVYCCSTPDGKRECLDDGACTKRVDEFCALPSSKQTPHCASWNDPSDPGWLNSMEGPCKSDAECWPGLACCGQHPNGRFCAPRSVCGQLASKPGTIPTWVYVGGVAVALAALAAILS
jgi:hypothetical protein